MQYAAILCGDHVRRDLLWHHIFYMQPLGISGKAAAEFSASLKGTSCTVSAEKGELATGAPGELTGGLSSTGPSVSK